MSKFVETKLKKKATDRGGRGTEKAAAHQPRPSCLLTWTLAAYTE